MRRMYTAIDNYLQRYERNTHRHREREREKRWMPGGAEAPAIPSLQPDPRL
jgi:ribosome-associated translation inhibitor RaiA